MKREDDQELWDLLGKSDAPKVSPFFARNVVRKVRETSGWRETVIGWLRPVVLVPSAAVAIALLGAALTLRNSAMDSPRTTEATLTATDAASSDEPPALIAQLDPEDFEVVADLDDLLASEEEESLWDDV